LKKLERFFSVFNKKPLDRLPFFADVGWWWSEHTRKGTHKPEYRNKDFFDIAEENGFIAELNPRYYLLQRENIETTEKTETTFDGEGSIVRGKGKIITRTPKGKLKTSFIITSESNLTREFPLKKVEDMKIMEYILDHSKVEPAFEGYSATQKNAGDNGLILALTPHSPLNTLLYDFMGQTNGLIALYKHRNEVESLMNTIDRFQDQIYKIAERVPSKVIKFGEHVHSVINDPRLFKKYQIPFFHRRVKQLHERGKICCCHWDGYFRDLLPLIRETGFDAIEGVTPKPGGDVTLAELKKSIEGTDIVLWGGIPASIFQEPYTDEYFKKYVRNVLKTIAPGDHFIVALGDNLGPTGYMRRIKIINNILEQKGYPIKT
jgi:hypothetical protein